MMPAINEMVLAVSSSAAALTIVKATVITTIALLAVRLVRGSRAAVRHTVLSAAFAILLVLPVAVLVAPPVRVTVPAAVEKRGMVPSGLTASRALPVRSSGGASSAGPQAAAPLAGSLWIWAWAAGGFLFLLPVGLGLRQVRAVRRAALPWPRGQALVDELALASGLDRHVAVLRHESLPGPMTCGVWHPAVVVPAEAENWGEGDLTRAMIHELEHVRRHDWLTQCLARVVCAAYWFHPLVWIAWRRLVLEAERSCDDAVLARSEPTAYADQLVGLARRLSTAARSPLLAMANPADLTTRVNAVLDGRQRRGRAGRISVALAAAVSAVLVLTVSPLRLVATPQTNAADTRVPQFRASTSLVVVTVTVADRYGNAVLDLTSDDFAITDDGVLQKIILFDFQKLDAQSNAGSYYLLGYYSPVRAGDDKFHSIQVTGKKEIMAQIESRAGYYAVGPHGQAAADAAIPATGNPLPPGVRPPVLLFKKEAEYSEEARKAKYQGTVTLMVEVNPSGTATNLRVVRSLGLGLDEKAIEAVKQWRFKPATKDGQPVTVETQVEVRFRLL